MNYFHSDLERLKVWNVASIRQILSAVFLLLFRLIGENVMLIVDKRVKSNVLVGSLELLCVKTFSGTLMIKLVSGI